MTDAELAAIEARANAATAGPWIPAQGKTAFGVYRSGANGVRLWIVLGELRVEFYGNIDRPLSEVEADGLFIAAARTDVPALVREVRRLRKALREEGT